MASNVLHYHDDGANRQTQATLAMFQALLCDGIEESWSKEFSRYEADIQVARWENCREQGYVLMLRNKNFSKQLNIAIFEHRNTDSICAIKWHELTMNSPTIATANFNDEVYSDKYDTTFDVPFGQASTMGSWLVEEFTDFWKENS